jgi:ABC-type dipeptide/oligopeptide/nickel transport system ATPase component
MEQQSLLSLRLSAHYAGRRDVLRNVSLDLGRGEILGLVGQSGCGKSTLALTILRLLHLKGGKTEGSVLLNGTDLMTLSDRQMRAVRGQQIGLVLQSPMSSLNPALRIGTQLEETWKAHKSGSEWREAVEETLASVSLPGGDEMLRRYPSQLSVGQAQRVLIAMAVLHRPQLVIADEPTSALDIITQSEILRLFGELSRKLGISILYISHDLLSVATISHRVAVMNAGEIVECGKTSDIFSQPRDPYTRKMVESLPVAPKGQSRAAGV